MIKSKSLPRIHLACGNDELRPALKHVFINKKHVVATDSHILVKYEKSVLSNWIEDIPDECFIEAYQYAKLTKPFLCANYLKESNLIKVLYRNGRKSYVEVLLPKNVDFKYPDYDWLFKYDDNLSQSGEINISANLLYILEKSMECTNHGIKILFQHGEYKPLIVKPYDQR
jgi:hypothetical protein